MTSQTTKTLLGYSLIGLAGPVTVILWPYLGAWTLLTLLPLLLVARSMTSVREDTNAIDADALTDAEDESGRDGDYKGPTLEEELRLNPAYSMVAGNVHHNITSTDPNPNTL